MTTQTAKPSSAGLPVRATGELRNRAERALQKAVRLEPRGSAERRIRAPRPQHRREAIAWSRDENPRSSSFVRLPVCDDRQRGIMPSGVSPR